MPPSKQKKELFPSMPNFPWRISENWPAQGLKGREKIHQKEFERDVKKHIDDISRKYILSEEGTIDYALMYLPSESVYYEVINNPNLFDYAGSKRILPVSPMTFY